MPFSHRTAQQTQTSRATALSPHRRKHVSESTQDRRLAHGGRPTPRMACHGVRLSGQAVDDDLPNPVPPRPYGCRGPVAPVPGEEMPRSGLLPRPHAVADHLCGVGKGAVPHNIREDAMATTPIRRRLSVGARRVSGRSIVGKAHCREGALSVRSTVGKAHEAY